MTKEFIKGFMHEDNTIDADAKFFSGDINIMTTEEFKSFSEDDNVEYVGFMEFTDGSMMDFYSKNGEMYAVEFDSYEEYDSFYA